MNLAFLIGHMDQGGAERQMTQLAAGLAGRGHRTTMLSLFPGGMYWDWLRGAPEVRLAALTRGRAERRLLTAARLWSAVGRLRRFLDAQRPVILYSALDLTNAMAWLATRTVPRTGLVWGLRTSNMNWPYPYRLPLDFCRLVSSTVPLVIANSAAGLDYHVQNLGFRPGRSMVIPNGIDTRRFRPDPSARRRVRAEWGLSPENTLIGQVARLDPVKDIPTFLRSARMVAAERPDAMFAIVGGGRPDYRDELEAEADRLGIADRVIWAGHRTDASDAINAFDLACSSSAHGEGFNNGLAEALACGVPAAATAVGDSAVVVGEAGRVVRPGDPAALAAACLDLLGRDRTELSQRARRRVVERFSLETLHRRTETALVLLWDRIKDDEPSGLLWTRPLH